MRRERKPLDFFNPDTKEKVDVMLSPPPMKDERSKLPAVEAAKAAATVAPATPNTRKSLNGSVNLFTTSRLPTGLAAAIRPLVWTASRRS